MIWRILRSYQGSSKGKGFLISIQIFMSCERVIEKSSRVFSPSWKTLAGGFSRFSTSDGWKILIITTYFDG